MLCKIVYSLKNSARVSFWPYLLFGASWKSDRFFASYGHLKVRLDTLPISLQISKIYMLFPLGDSAKKILKKSLALLYFCHSV